MNNHMANDQFEYMAFISYSRSDEKWAKWLQYKLEHYILPSSVIVHNPEKPINLRPIFRDKTDLRPGILSERITEALSSSRFLIVVCSPNAVKSEWINKEVDGFKAIGRHKYIIPFIVGGKANAKGEDSHMECFPLSLRNMGKLELLGANIEEMGREAALVKVISCMLDVRFDSLWQRYRQEEIAEKKRIKEQNNTLLISQSNAVSQLAIRLIDEGERYIAERLCLEVLPKNVSKPDRPYVPSAEFVLRRASYQTTVYQQVFSLEDSFIIRAGCCNNYPILIYIYRHLDEKECYLSATDITNGRKIFNVILPEPGLDSPLINSLFMNGVFCDGLYIYILFPGGIINKYCINNYNEREEILLEDGGGRFVDHYDSRFSKSGTLIVCHSDNTLLGWDVLTGKKLFQYDCKEMTIFNIIIDENEKKIICLSSEGDYIIYDYIINHPLLHNKISCKRLFYDSIHKKIVTDQKHTFLIYNLRRKQEKCEYISKGDLCGLSYDGNIMYLNVSKGRHFRINLFDCNQKKVIGSISHVPHKVEFVSEVGQYLICGSEFGITAYIKQKAPQLKLQVKKRIAYISISSDGQYVSLCHWHQMTPQCCKMPVFFIPYFLGGGSNGSRISISSSGRWMIDTLYKQGLSVKNVQENVTFTLEEENFYDAIRFVGINHLAVVNQKGVFILWDVEKKKQLYSIHLVSCKYRNVFISEGHCQGNIAVCFSGPINDCNKDKSIVFFLNIVSNDNRRIEVDLPDVSYCTFSYDDSKLTLVNNQYVVVMNVLNGKIQKTFKNARGEMASLSKNGKYLLINSMLTTIEVYNISTKTLIFRVEMPMPISYSSFSLNEDNIVVILYDGSIKVIDFLPLSKLLKNKRKQYKEMEFTAVEKNRYFLI